MPVRRRLTKRRDAEGLRDAWIDVLGAGFDHFDALADQGVAVDTAGRPDLGEAREAWQLYGAHVIANRDPRLGPPWGEQVFGPFRTGRA